MIGLQNKKRRVSAAFDFGRDDRTWFVCGRTFPRLLTVPRTVNSLPLPIQVLPNMIRSGAFDTASYHGRDDRTWSDCGQTFPRLSTVPRTVDSLPLPFKSSQIKTKKRHKSAALVLVGMTGLEPAASTSQTSRATNCATSRCALLLYQITRSLSRESCLSLVNI